MELKRGMRDKLDKYINTNLKMEVEMSISGNGVYDFCCFGVDSKNKLSDDRYMIFYNQVTSPQNEIMYKSTGNTTVFQIELSKFPQNIDKLVFTSNIDGNGTMGEIAAHSFSIKQNGNEVLSLNMTGSDFKQEKAIITVEIYRKDSWRINAVASGFNGGLSDLLKHYGGEEIKSTPTSTSNINSLQSKKSSPNLSIQNKPKMPQKVNLQKGQKVSLLKNGNSLEEILINLNWKQPTGFFSSKIDLDLGCLYELKDGTKSAVQALGNTFGSLNNPPYIALDGDDRSGAASNGENLRINGKMISKIKRILVYTFIYDGIANWKGADAVVSVKCPGNPEIIVNLDDYGSRQRMCAIALLTNDNDTLSVEKIVRFFDGQQPMDRAFNWGLRWYAGRK